MNFFYGSNAIPDILVGDQRKLNQGVLGTCLIVEQDCSAATMHNPLSHGLLDSVVPLAGQKS